MLVLICDSGKSRLWLRRPEFYTPLECRVRSFRLEPERQAEESETDCMKAVALHYDIQRQECVSAEGLKYANASTRSGDEHPEAFDTYLPIKSTGPTPETVVLAIKQMRGESCTELQSGSVSSVDVDYGCGGPVVD